MFGSPSGHGGDGDSDAVPELMERIEKIVNGSVSEQTKRLDSLQAQMTLLTQKVSNWTSASEKAQLQPLSQQEANLSRPS